MCYFKMLIAVNPGVIKMFKKCKILAMFGM